MKNNPYTRAVGNIQATESFKDRAMAAMRNPVAEDKSPLWRKATALAAAVLILVVSIIAIPPVRAAIGQLFTFIPGVGVVKKGDGMIYTMNTIVGQTKAAGAKASLLQAVYANGNLSLTVSIEGRSVMYGEADDFFAFYINDKPVGPNDPWSRSISSSSNSAMLNWGYETTAPDSGTVVEVEIAGFPERLSFTLQPCLDIDDLAQIGPTVAQNGISLTTIANRIDGKLTVWCYPFYDARVTKDRIEAYGDSFFKPPHVETENGRIEGNYSGMSIKGRLIFDVPDDDGSATLHIPCLSMLRSEKKKFTIDLPSGYETEQRDSSLKTSLGTIRVTEVRREPNELQETKDIIWVKFEFESNDDNVVLYSFNMQPMAGISSFGETGKLEYAALDIDRKDKKVTLNIDELYYYLIGEYVIPLDMG